MLPEKANLSEVVATDYYIEHYRDFLPRYISHGRPTQDTMDTYCTRIHIFLSWCHEKQIHPLSVHDYQMRIFLEDYMRGHKDSTISLTVVAVRTFFMIAKRLRLIADNPCKYIHTGTSMQNDTSFRYFTLDQIKEVSSVFEQEINSFVRARNLSILYLMSIEGLRNVEIFRMNDEDINWEQQTILVHGKGHDGIIYPSERTMNILEVYILVRPKPIQDYHKTPTFISNSHRSFGHRISRNGIRKVMDRALRICGYKQKGISCHVFRHSCGTNLYAATKDLRVVQETLRQRDPKVTARYAHVQQRMEKRYTNLLDPEQ